MVIALVSVMHVPLRPASSAQSPHAGKPGEFTPHPPGGVAVSLHPKHHSPLSKNQRIEAMNSVDQLQIVNTALQLRVNHWFADSPSTTGRYSSMFVRLILLTVASEVLRSSSTLASAMAALQPVQGAAFGGAASRGMCTCAGSILSGGCDLDGGTRCL